MYVINLFNARYLSAYTVHTAYYCRSTLFLVAGTIGGYHVSDICCQLCYIEVQNKNYIYSKVGVRYNTSWLGLEERS